MEYAVYNRQDYCGFWRRCFANALDGIFLGIAYTVVSVILQIISSLLGIVYPKFSEWMLCTIIFWAYMIWFKGYRGATPGYYILRIRIISINGVVVTIKQIVIRIISSFFSAIPLGLGYIWIAIDDNKQAWHDKIAGTYVIRSNANPVRTIEMPRSGLIRTRLFASLVLVTLVLFIGFVGGVMYISKNAGYIITDEGMEIIFKTEGGMALIIAAQNGRTETVDALLAGWADVNAKSMKGFTALMLAAQNGHTEIVQQLLDKGADVNAKSIMGLTALMIAAQNGNTEAVKALLAGGADVVGTGLIFAAEKGQTDTVYSKGKFSQYYNKGIEYYKQEKYDQSGEEFKKALELKPNHVYALYGLGNTHYCKAKYDEAIKIYKQAIRINPDYAKVHYSLSLAYSKLGMARDAEKEKEIFSKLVRKNRGSAR